MAGIVIGEICPFCQKFRSPLDIIHWPGGAKLCTSCEQRHYEALNALSTGLFSGECSECYTPMSGRNVQMAVHFENGIYRAVCMQCDPAYTRARRELYAGTQFAHDLKLN